MMICHHCPHANPDDSLFCESCGQALDPRCPGCRKQNHAWANFCRFCGAQLRPESTAPGVEPLMEPEAAAPVPLEPDQEPEAADPAPPEMDEVDEPALSILGEHQEALRIYAEFWFAPESRPAGMIGPEAAYYLLQHAGMISRYTGNLAVLDGLRAVAGNDRRRMIADACEYAAGSALARAAGQLTDDALEPEQLEQLFDLLLARDGAEETLRSARHLADEPGYRDDPALRSSLACAVTVVSKVDELLRPRTDLLAAVSSQFDQIRDSLAIPVDAARQWWLLPPTGPDAEELDFTELASLVAARAAVSTPRAESGPVAAALTPDIVSEPVAEPAPVTQTALADRKAPIGLAADSAGAETEDRSFDSPADPAVCGVLLVTEGGEDSLYHFLFHTPGRMERTTAWDGGAIVADGADRSFEAQVSRGRAAIRLRAPAIGFRLRVPDGRVLALRLL